MIDAYEYCVVKQVRVSTIQEIQDFLNRYGNDGWELAGIDYGCFIFKRKKTNA